MKVNIHISDLEKIIKNIIDRKEVVYSVNGMLYFGDDFRIAGDVFYIGKDGNKPVLTLSKKQKESLLNALKERIIVLNNPIRARQSFIQKTR